MSRSPAPTLSGLRCLRRLSRQKELSREPGVGSSLALPQKDRVRPSTVSRPSWNPRYTHLESDPDPTAGQLVEPIRAARDAIRECADRLDVVADTDLALALAAVPSQDATGTELRAGCNAALDAHDAAIVVLARWCDEHPGNVHSVS
jgi:hypothetical protein